MCLMGGHGEVLLPQGETHVLGSKGTGPGFVHLDVQGRILQQECGSRAQGIAVPSVLAP